MPSSRFSKKWNLTKRRSPEPFPRFFPSHPPTPERIEATQKEIATILPAREQYIVTTSEFDVIKRRLQAIESNQKISDKNPNKPSLRKKTTPADSGGSDDFQ